MHHLMKHKVTWLVKRHLGGEVIKKIAIFFKFLFLDKIYLTYYLVRPVSVESFMALSLPCHIE